MNKSFRQGQILKVIRNKEVYTQEELARELSELGIQTTQVTLSRDMRELALVKTPEGYRQLPTETSGPNLADVANDIVARLGRKIDTEDFRADRARQTPHFKTVSRHNCRLRARCLWYLSLTPLGQFQ